MTYLDTPELAAKVSPAAICADCLRNRFGATPRQIFAQMTKLGRCDSCLKQTVVRRLRLTRSAE
jgi:hypothetical protein